jgi:hypothetical protein
MYNKLLNNCKKLFKNRKEIILVINYNKSIRNNSKSNKIFPHLKV